MYDDIALESQIFVLVLAREGSFARAAKRLHISQPALTRKIKAVEQQVGVKLFTRFYHRLELTPAGKLFLPEAQASVRHGERAWELARQQARVESGPLRVGYSPYISGDLLPALGRWQFENGGTRSVTLESASTPQLMERVIRGGLHVGFGVLPVLDEDLWVGPVAREPFCLCVPKNHRLAQKGTVSARELDCEIVVWMPREAHPGFYDRTLEYMEGLGIRPRFHEAGTGIQAMDIVAHGFAVALLPRSFTRFSRTGIVFKQLTDLYLRIETALFVRLDQKHGALQDQVQAMLAQLRSLKTNVQ